MEPQETSSTDCKEPQCHPSMMPTQTDPDVDLVCPSWVQKHRNGIPEMNVQTWKENCFTCAQTNIDQLVQDAQKERIQIALNAEGKNQAFMLRFGSIVQEIFKIKNGRALLVGLINENQIAFSLG